MEPQDSSSGPKVPERRQGRRIFDWISEPRSIELTPFQQFTVDIDGSKSPLGPMKDWPAQLRHMVLLIFADSSPAVVYWGDGNTIVYNEPYTQLIGQKHPHLQGQDPKIQFAEIWDYFGPMLDKQKEDVITVVGDEAFLLLHRHGFLEETFFSWKFVPVIGPEGWVVASHATVHEVTREIISDRRLRTVRTLSLELSKAKTIKDLWRFLIKALENAALDLPLALLYTISDPSEISKYLRSSPAGTPNSVHVSLEASIGVHPEHTSAPAQFDLTADQNWLSAAFQKAMKELVQVEIRISNELSSIFGGIEWRGYGAPSSSAIVCPITPTNAKTVLAFLVVGLNPRRKYDEDFQGFIHLLTQQVTTPTVSTVILREEIERR